MLWPAPVFVRAGRLGSAVHGDLLSPYPFIGASSLLRSPLPSPRARSSGDLTNEALREGVELGDEEASERQSLDRRTAYCWSARWRRIVGRTVEPSAQTAASSSPPNTQPPSMPTACSDHLGASRNGSCPKQA